MAWVYVEGRSDQLGLESLWAGWRARLAEKGWGFRVVPLSNKANFLKKFGARAAEKLVANDVDIVVGLPDLHPTAPFKGVAGLDHADAETLKDLQRRSVRAALLNVYGVSEANADRSMARLLPSVFRHDFEMLLLAAADALRIHLGTKEKLGAWRVPVEDQNLDKPPKRIVEQLFLTKSARRRAYRETKDAPAILRRVTDLSSILRTKGGPWTCPEFVATLKWLGDKTGVPVCKI